jgi:hypothetical protein
MSTQLVSKKRNLNLRGILILFGILLGLVFIACAIKGAYDFVNPPSHMPVYSEVDVDLDRDGTSDLFIQKVKVVDVKTGTTGNTLVIQGDLPGFLAPSQAKP